jgi:hypothetical protein
MYTKEERVHVEGGGRIYSSVLRYLEKKKKLR